MCGESPHLVSDGNFKSLWLCRSHEGDSEIRILRPISNLHSHLQSSSSFPAWGLLWIGHWPWRTKAGSLVFPCWVGPGRNRREVRGIGNPMVPVTVEGIFSPPGRCLQLAFSLTCISVFFSKIPLLHLANYNSHNKDDACPPHSILFSPPQLQSL